MARAKARIVLDALHHASDPDTLLHLVVQELGKHAMPDKVKVAFLDFAAPLLPRCAGLHQGGNARSSSSSSRGLGAAGGSASESNTHSKGPIGANNGLLKPLLLKLAPLAVSGPNTSSPLRAASSSPSSFALKGSNSSGSGSSNAGSMGAVAQRDRAELAASARDTILALAKCCGGSAVVATLKGGLPLEHVTALKSALSEHGGDSVSSVSSVSSSYANTNAKTPTREINTTSSAYVVVLPWDTPAAKPPLPSPLVISPTLPKKTPHDRHRSPQSDQQQTRKGQQQQSPLTHHHRRSPLQKPTSSPSAQTSATKKNHTQQHRAASSAMRAPSSNLSSELEDSSSSAAGYSLSSFSPSGGHHVAAAASSAAVEAALQQLSSTQPASVRAAGARTIWSLCTPKLQLPSSQVGPTLLLLLEGLHAAPPPPLSAHGTTSKDATRSSSNVSGSNRGSSSGGTVVELDELGRLHAFLSALHALHNSSHLERLDQDGFTSLVAQRLLALGDGAPLPSPPHNSSSSSGGSCNSSSGPIPYEVAQKATEVQNSDNGTATHFHAACLVRQTMHLPGVHSRLCMLILPRIFLLLLYHLLIIFAHFQLYLFWAGHIQVLANLLIRVVSLDYSSPAAPASVQSLNLSTFSPGNRAPAALAFLAHALANEGNDRPGAQLAAARVLALLVCVHAHTCLNIRT